MAVTALATSEIVDGAGGVLNTTGHYRILTNKNVVRFGQRFLMRNILRETTATAKNFAKGSYFLTMLPDENW